MYEGPIIYESQVRDYFLIGVIIFLIVMIILFYILCFYRIFKKAGKNPWTALIPIYNVIIMLNIATLPSYYFLLMLIPVVNIYPFVCLSKEVARSFQKSGAFAVGLFFLPVIYYPILAFSDSRYFGINQEKVESIILKDVPTSLPVKETPVVAQQTPETKPEVLETLSPTPSIETLTNTPSPTPDTPVVTPRPADYKECPSCHNKVKADAKTCFICGHQF